MKMTKSKFFINLSAIAIAITITACGGSGGGSASTSSSGGSSSTGSSGGSVTYTGSTAPATITASNADDFGVSILEGAATASGMSPFDAATSSANGKKAQRAAMMSILADQAVSQVQQAMDGNLPTGVTYQGGCGGTAVYTDNSNYSGTSGTIDMTWTYTDYCLGGLSQYGYQITQHGSMNITGNFTMSGNAPIFQNFTLTVPGMTYTVATNSGSATESFSGSLALVFDGTTANTVTSMTLNMDFDVNGVTFRIENYQVVRDVTATPDTLTISGRFYHPVHGYVDVATPEAFDLVPGSNPEEFCSGTMSVTGNGGVVEFTADATCSTYDVCYTPTGGTQTCQYGVPW